MKITIPQKARKQFGALRDKARAGDGAARERLLWHIARWREAGWAEKTIARRIGVCSADLTRIAPLVRRPVLLKRPHGLVGPGAGIRATTHE